MADWTTYRPSANVVNIGPDPIRRNWLDGIAYLPDEYRETVGFSTDVDPSARKAAQMALFNERYIKNDPSIVARATPQGPLPPSGLAFLGQSDPQPTPSFRQMNDDAVLNQDVGRMLTQGTDYRSNDTLIGMALSRLGQR